jgi:hypothetical protein
MLTRKIKLLSIAFTATILCSPLTHAASADPMDIDPNLQAKIAREKLKQTRGAGGSNMENGMSNMGNSNKNSGCGQVDIGNSDSSQKGSRAMSQREKTVIVTGPVINATKCR